MSIIEAFNRRRERLDPAALAEKTRLIDGRAFTYDSTPFLRYPTACLGDTGGTCRVILQSPAQVGKTVALENFLAWICAYDRQNALLILDSDKTGKRMSKNRLRPFLRNTCGINTKESRLMNPDASKEISNIGLAPGANLIIGSSKSASDLCSTPVKYLLCDELDRWADSLRQEGDPLALAFQRQMRFPSSMSLLTSTPTAEGGRIHQQFLLGTQEVWGVICQCGKWFEVIWDQIDWNGSTPLVHCPHCGTCYEENSIKALEHVYSKPQNASPYRDKCGRVAHSFAITATLCHAFYTWSYLKEEEQASLKLGEVSYQSFQNTRLGEVYKPSEECVFYGPDIMRISCAPYDVNNLPDDIRFIVAGIDTQESGLAMEVCGFSKDRTRVYGIEWLWIPGKPNKLSELWNGLREALKKTYRRSDGTQLKIAVSCQDSGGHFTSEVYSFSLRQPYHYPIKGTSDDRNIITRTTRITLKTIGVGTGRILLTFVGTAYAKDKIMASLDANLRGEKAFLWPKSSSYDEDYFEQLTAEKRIQDNKGKVRWICLPGRHNEALDCRVYAMTAAEIFAQKTCTIASLRKTEAGEASEKRLEMKRFDNIETPPPVKHELLNERANASSENPHINRIKKPKRRLL